MPNANQTRRTLKAAKRAQKRKLGHRLSYFEEKLFQLAPEYEAAFVKTGMVFRGINSSALSRKSRLALGLE